MPCNPSIFSATRSAVQIRYSCRLEAVINDQDTSLEAYTDFPSFHGEHLEELLAWLRRILLNNASNVTRHYEQTEKRDVARETPLEGQRYKAEPMSLAASPSKASVSREEQERLEGAIMTLPDDMRAIILLRHRQHLSFIDIGKELGRSEDAVRKTWTRAIERLQKELTRKRHAT